VAGIVSRRMSLRRFSRFMAILCLVGLAAAAQYAMLNPAIQYNNYNRQEIAAYSFVSESLSDENAIYTDMKSVNGLVLVGNHLNANSGFDFTFQGKHYADPSVNVFYSPSQADFKENDKYILIANYMYIYGIVPMNELCSPPEPAARQVLLSHKDIGLLYNNGDAQLLAAGSVCYSRNIGLLGKNK